MLSLQVIAFLPLFFSERRFYYLHFIQYKHLLRSNVGHLMKQTKPISDTLSRMLSPERLVNSLCKWSIISQQLHFSFYCLRTHSALHSTKSGTIFLKKCSFSTLWIQPTNNDNAAVSKLNSASSFLCLSEFQFWEITNFFLFFPFLSFFFLMWFNHNKICASYLSQTLKT